MIINGIVIFIFVVLFLHFVGNFVCNYRVRADENVWQKISTGFAVTFLSLLFGGTLVATYILIIHIIESNLLGVYQ